MTPGQQYRYQTVTVPAGTTLDLPTGGDFIYIYAVTRSAFLSFDSGPPVPFWSRQVFNASFERVTILNTAPNTSDITVVYLIGMGEPPNVQERRATVYNLNPVITATVGAGSKVQLFLTASYYPADRVWLCIPTGQPGGLSIGDHTIAFNSGLFLPVGVPIVVNTSTDIYAFNNGASSVNITAMVEKIA